ncbi:hypothetical protein GA0070609_4356 [Micromonospora echinaurantiaca]|uniref:Uncharacterized protein n=1 Tax=Micromonospora echinaurantiaca TaxID=47857 RepID=A0A1C5JE12_9ACTN|nr:hypothetical protein GA0070609_4356 [Micromonospora echinaurantiaca]
MRPDPLPRVGTAATSGRPPLHVRVAAARARPPVSAMREVRMIAPAGVR